MVNLGDTCSDVFRHSSGILLLYLILWDMCGTLQREAAVCLHMGSHMRFVKIDMIVGVFKFYQKQRSGKEPNVVCQHLFTGCFASSVSWTTLNVKTLVGLELKYYLRFYLCMLCYETVCDE